MKNSDFVFKGVKYGPLMHPFVPVLFEALMIILYLGFMEAPIINLWPKKIGPEFLDQFDRVWWDIFGVVFISFFLSLALADYINGKAMRPKVTWPWAIPLLIAGFYALFIIFVLYEQGGQYSSRSLWNHSGIVSMIFASFLTIMVTKHIAILYLLAMLIMATFIVGFLPAILIMLPLALVQGGVITIKWLGQKSKI